MKASSLTERSMILTMCLAGPRPRGAASAAGGPRAYELGHLVDRALGEVEVAARVAPHSMGAHRHRPAAGQHAPLRRVHGDAGDLIRDIDGAGAVDVDVHRVI